VPTISIYIEGDGLFVLAEEKYKHKLFDVLTTALIVLWSLSAGIFLCECNVISSATARISTNGVRLIVRRQTTRPLKRVLQIADP